jgi:hypothetical protein
MPLVAYELVLNTTVEGARDVLRVRIGTDHGRVVDFVAQYETEIAEQIVPVVRYDGSHGHGHRDLLGRQGETIDKEWSPEHFTLAQTLIKGLQDIIDNWSRYRDEFMHREWRDEGGR